MTALVREGYPSRMKSGHEKTPEVIPTPLPVESVSLTWKVVHILPHRQTGIEWIDIASGYLMW